MDDNTFMDRLVASARLGSIREALALIPQMRAQKLEMLKLIDVLERSLTQEWAKMTGVNTVTFNERSFRRFKVVYARAVKNGLTQFTFEGHEYLVAYAKYLIEYLEDKFRREG